MPADEQPASFPPMRVEVRCRLAMMDGTVVDLDMSDWSQECHIDDPELREVLPPEN